MTRGSAGESQRWSRIQPLEPEFPIFNLGLRKSIHLCISRTPNYTFQSSMDSTKSDSPIWYLTLIGDWVQWREASRPSYSSQRVPARGENCAIKTLPNPKAFRGRLQCAIRRDGSTSPQVAEAVCAGARFSFAPGARRCIIRLERPGENIV